MPKPEYHPITLKQDYERINYLNLLTEQQEAYIDLRIMLSQWFTGSRTAADLPFIHFTH